MSDPREQPANSASLRLAVLLAGLLAVIGCSTPTRRDQPPTTLRIGMSNAPSLSAERGVQQFINNISSEGLLRVNQEGRLEPWLAESWRTTPDGLHLTVTLRRGMKFHDGSPVDAEAVTNILRDALPRTLKSAYEDVESIRASGDRDIDFTFRHPSSFVADSFIDVTIQKAGKPPVATGPFMAKAGGAGAAAEMVAFDGYYVGRPSIGAISFSTYPNSRAAWADLLRDRLDMLYEVGADALDTMRGASNVAVYSFERPFQYLVFLNPANPTTKSAAVRRALNEAIDRNAIVAQGLGGHGTPSVGPVSQHHWAFRQAGTTFSYAPQVAASQISKPFTLKCLTLADPPFEQLALVVKQQLRAIGVDLQVEQVSGEQAASTLTKHEFEAVLLEAASGWSVLRAYRFWHSQGSQNMTGFSSSRVDATLDEIRHAANDDQYRAAVARFQEAIADDPPAIFLAWSERSRAVTKRFDVQPQPGRDILGTMRMWRPSADNRNATNN